VACSWAPDSRLFVTSATHPRLRTANGYRVFTYNGSGPILSKDIEVLYSIVFRPALPGVFPDRPQSPGRVGPGVTEGAAGGAGGAGAGAAAAPVRVGLSVCACEWRMLSCSLFLTTTVLHCTPLLTCTCLCGRVCTRAERSREACGVPTPPRDRSHRGHDEC
jgi:hypothetical protein